jgi:ParB-like chromosome segregation protein Spo0J
MAQNIENIKTNELIPYAGNTRAHSENQVAQVAASIKEFGFTNPILVDAANGIIAGHGRLLAAQKLGMDVVPCLRLDHLTDAQRRAYVIADNKLALNATWDEAALATEIERLLEDNFDLDLTGFGEDELGKFNVDEAELPQLEDGEKKLFQQITFVLHDEQHETVKEALQIARDAGGHESAVNENSNGNAIAYICRKFMDGQS